MATKRMSMKMVGLYRQSLFMSDCIQYLTEIEINECISSALKSLSHQDYMNISRQTNHILEEVKNKRNTSNLQFGETQVRFMLVWLYSWFKENQIDIKKINGLSVQIANYIEEKSIQQETILPELR
jgi:hypothetical protein